MQGASLRPIGNLLALAGAAVIGWSLLVVFWQDPFTKIYTYRAQQSLEAAYADIERTYRPPPVVVAADAGATGEEPRHDGPRLPEAARAYRLAALEGEPIARIIVPRLGVDSVMVNGASGADLRKGPGRDLRSAMPGEGRLVYVAGHRTTYGAPFRHIERLRRGDDIVVVTPYGRFRYEVTGHRIVRPEDTWILRPQGRWERIALQASHPPYSARERYVAYGRLVDARPRGST